jgi:RHS repeat-associated protein
VVNQVELAYNEFGQITSDRQSHSGTVSAGTPQVQYGYENGSANTIRQTTLTYPDGRVLTYGYGAGGSTDDNAGRVASITDDDSTQLVAYEYLGLGSFVETQYPQPDVRNTLISIPPANDPDTGDIYSGLDRFSRVKDCRWYNDTTSSDVDRFQYGYDRASNRLWRENVVAASLGKDFDELYSYDGLYRLKDMERGRLNTTHTAITSQTFGECWGLDETGNWDDFRQADTGSTWTLEQTRTASEVNEITGITNSVGAAWSVPVYDPAGNMTTIPKPADPTQSYTATYDAWNRLVRLEEDIPDSSSSSASVTSSASSGTSASSASSGTAGSSSTSGLASSVSSISSPSSVSSGLQPVQENEYDARRFRIVRHDYSDGSLSETRHFFYTSDWRNIEERTGSAPASAPPDRHFVWGQRYIDDLVLRDRSTTGTLNERLYATQDANWNVTAIADTTATIQQRFAYDPYGNTTVLTPAFTTTTDAFDWETTFCGYRFDITTALMPVRHRFYNTALGNWIQRDLLEVPAALYSYTGSRPIGTVDPSGLQELKLPDRDKLLSWDEINPHDRRHVTGWGGYRDSTGIYREGRPTVRGYPVNLVFDGSTLCFVNADSGKCLGCFTARSGQPIKDANGKPVTGTDGMPLFAPATQKSQRQEDSGPIPEGKYWVPTSRSTLGGHWNRRWPDDGPWATADLRKWNDSNAPWKGTIERPYKTGPWGDWKVRLSPQDGTNTFGRNNFNIHGGDPKSGGIWGSIGCIDLLTCDSAFFSDLSQFGYQRLTLVVDYSGKSTRQDCPKPQQCGKQ